MKKKIQRKEQEDWVEERKEREKHRQDIESEKPGAEGLILVSSAVTPDASAFETRRKPGATFDEVR